MSRKSEELDAEVGERIRYARRASGVSQQELAQALGITFQQLQKYEIGRNRITAGKLKIVADYFDKDIGFFFDENAEVNTINNLSKTHFDIIKIINNITCEDGLKHIRSAAKFVERNKKLN